MKNKNAIIIGAGPAGLTAAYELQNRTSIHPIIYEMSGEIGGISKTVNYKGNRMDLGPHRFFSKSDRVLDFWFSILPLEGTLGDNGKAISRESTDKIMLCLNRLTRILFLGRFFDYPISMSLNTLKNLGFTKLLKIFASYVSIRLSPIKEEKSLEDFFINRFGKELHSIFFKDYTEKVWGISCSEIPASWGAQRVKGLSISKTIIHALKSITARGHLRSQKDTETSLIHSFYYPKLGSGQIYEEIASRIRERGGEISLNNRVVGINSDGNRIKSVDVRNESTGSVTNVEGDFFISTMPVSELIEGFRGPVPEDVKAAARGLPFRDFLNVGLLLRKIKLTAPVPGSRETGFIRDNWIYIQEHGVKIVRLDIFNNFGDYMLEDRSLVWIGAEYILNETEELWKKSDEEMARFAIDELVRISIIDKEDVLDYHVVRMLKAYPAYFNTYGSFDIVRSFTDSFENLFLIGRNGMHKYNNMDHSILTAMLAAENIANGTAAKDNIWNVNTESDYHEEK